MLHPLDSAYTPSDVLHFSMSPQGFFHPHIVQGGESRPLAKWFVPSKIGSAVGLGLHPLRWALQRGKLSIKSGDHSNGLCASGCRGMLHFWCPEFQSNGSYGTSAGSMVLLVLLGAHASRTRLATPKISLFWSLFLKRGLIEINAAFLGQAYFYVTLPCTDLR